MEKIKIIKNRRRISDEDIQNWLCILLNWNVIRNGKLSWNSFIDEIEKNVNYRYQRSSLFKVNDRQIARAFKVTQKKHSEHSEQSGKKGSGETLSRQKLLDAYHRHIQKIGILEEENKKLLQVNEQYLKLMFKNDVYPDKSGF